MHYEQSRKLFVDELHELMVRHNVTLETVTDGYGDDRIAFAGPPGKPRTPISLPLGCAG